jgi:prephenate dehydratase
LEAHLAKKALTEANAAFMCGFKTSESNIEDLKHPSYERFFTVMKDQAQSEEYRSLQLKKMTILYCLCQLKSGSGSEKKTTTFTEYVAEFLKKDVAS